MNWHRVIAMIEDGDFQNFQQYPHNNNKLTLFNILYAIFSSIRPLLRSKLLEFNIQNLSKENENLFIYNLACIVEENPKFYRKNYDFSKISQLEGTISSHFQNLLRSNFYKTTWINQWSNMNPVQRNQIGQQLFSESFELNKEIREVVHRNEIDMIEDSPRKKQKIDEELNLQFNQRFQRDLNKIIYLLDKYQFVTLCGPFSSGKNFLIEQLKGQKLVVHIDSSVDFASLLGSYVCTETVGVFEFTDGPILHSIKQGIILIIKNMQEASHELLIQFARLQKTRSVRSQGQTYYAHKNFRIICVASVSSEDASLKISEKVYQFFGTQDIFYKIHQFNQSEKIDILKQRFPLVFQEPLGTCFTKLINNSLLRDFVKLATRFQQQVITHYGDVFIHNLYLTEELRKKLFIDAKQILNENSLEELIEIFGLHLDEALLLTTLYNADIRKFDSFISTSKLGQIPRNKFLSHLTIQKEQQEIIYNLYSSQIIENILSSLLQNETCLLVGDTGCGKTTLSQHCAHLFGKKLHVFNLSEGSDAQDLIGGFRPLDIHTLVKINYKKFIKHFSKTVGQNKNEQFLLGLQQLLQKNNSKSFKLLVQAMLQTTDRLLEKDCDKSWIKIKENLQRLIKSLQEENKMSFYFLTGNLIKAMKKGDWVLIDEINLATNELLQKILPAVEGSPLLFFERGDQEPIIVHPHFRLIGCMNPGSDVGKKELPQNIKAKFTTLNLLEMTSRSDLIDFVKGMKVTIDPIKTADFYLNMKYSSANNLLDANIGIIHYSLRNLARALNYIKKKHYSDETVYNGLALGFGSGLSQDGLDQFNKMVEQEFKLNMNRAIPKINEMKYKINDNTVSIYGFLLDRGDLQIKPSEEQDFLVTDGNFQALLSLLRSVSGSGLPVLLEGPTSAGKTSLVNYLANLIGQKCHRINNHQNTDIEEYLGSYTSIDGQIKFQEGLLVEAIRNGDWVILDELNLARSEILEHLNRLLDDNQELFLPETQTVLNPHKRFRIFATQNPVTYAGRKMLSKAFRNRFIQITVGDISSEDMQQILKKRCLYVPPTHIPLMLQSFKELNLYKTSEHLFMQKSGMITLRDLIKWGTRMRNGTNSENPKEALAIEGFYLLAEKLREPESKQRVKGILQSIFNFQFEEQRYYEDFVKENIINQLENSNNSIQWNNSFNRMAALTLKAVQNKEPVLLIGPAGVGKTTLATVLGQLFNVQTKTLVAHQYLEVSDFVGALRPARAHDDSNKIFEWQDGPLLECLKNDGVFLIDEINMCPESVLEGLNSVLEIPPSLTVNDKMYSLKEGQKFVIISAMNPSGDWGKKELTPALRSRFTEIYIQNPLNSSLDEIRFIVTQFFNKFQDQSVYIEALTSILFKYNQDYTVRFQLNELTYRDLINIRDVVKQLLQKFNVAPQQYVMYALEISVLMTLSNNVPQYQFKEIKDYFIATLSLNEWNPLDQFQSDGLTFGCSPFLFQIKTKSIPNYCVDAQPQNLCSLIKATTLDNKPIMVQGPQSCGKTSSIEFIASLLQKPTILIIVDEHTDLSELIGIDQPNNEENAKSKFKFYPGPLLDGILKGSWIILKHLNMAPQNVLEGLNSVFDHRQEIFVPEVGQTFKVHPDCKIFAVQNPVSLGGGRKGLPASFLNRFIKVNYQGYDEKDNFQIVSQLEPSLKPEQLQQHHKQHFSGKPYSLVSYLKYFRALSQTSDLSIIANSCLNEINYIQPDTNIEKKILSRNSSMNIQQRQILYNLIHIQEIIKETKVLGVYIKGPKRSGKKMIIKSLAQIFQRKVRYLKLSSMADSSDLFGNYDQLSNEGILQTQKSKLKKMIKKISQNCNNVNLQDSLQQALDSQKYTIQGVIQFIDSMSTSMSDEKLQTYRQQCLQLQQLFKKQLFVWTESELINAIRNGDWVIIEDINQINPTILPKLIPIIRCGRGEFLPFFFNGNQQIEMHKDFQIFFTDSDPFLSSFNINVQTLQAYCYTFDLSKIDNNFKKNFTQDLLRIVEQEFKFYPQQLKQRVKYHFLNIFEEINDSDTLYHQLYRQIDEFKIKTEPYLALNQSIDLISTDMDSCDEYQDNELNIQMKCLYFMNNINMVPEIEFCRLLSLLINYFGDNQEKQNLIQKLLVENYSLQSINQTEKVLPFIQTNLQLLKNQNELKTKQLFISIKTSLLEIYQKNIIRYPLILKSQIEFFIEWLTSEHLFTQTFHIMQVIQNISNPLTINSLDMNQLTILSLSARVLIQQQSVFNLNFQNVKPKILQGKYSDIVDKIQQEQKLLMPKNKEQLEYKYVIATLTETCQDQSQVSQPQYMNLMKFKYQHFVSSIHKMDYQALNQQILSSIYQDLDKKQYNFINTIDLIDINIPNGQQFSNLQQLIMEHLILVCTRSGLLQVSLNEFPIYSYMQNFKVNKNLYMRYIQEETQDRYQNLSISFSEVYRQLEYNKLVQNELFELVISWQKNVVDYQELMCIQQTRNNELIQAATFNVSKPEQLLLQDCFSNIEKDIYLHILLWEKDQNISNIYQYSNFLRDALITSSLSQINILEVLIQNYIKSCSHQTYLEPSSPQLLISIKNSYQQRMNGFFQQYNLILDGNEEQSLFELFTTASSVFTQCQDQESLYIYANQETIDCQMSRSQTEAIQTQINSNQEAFYMVTHEIISFPILEKQLQILKQKYLDQLKKIVIRTISKDNIKLIEQFLQENTQYIISLTQSFENKSLFVKLAKGWLISCYKKYWLTFKDLLLPIFYPLLLLCDLYHIDEIIPEQNYEDDFLSKLLLRNNMESISVHGKSIFFTDLQQEEDQLGDDKYRNYLLRELKGLIKDEYQKLAPVKQEDIKVFVASELNELEIHSNELLIYYLQETVQETKLHLTEKYQTSIITPKSQFTQLCIQGGLVGIKEPQMNVLLLHNLLHQISNDQMVDNNIFKDNSIYLSIQLNFLLRDLLQQVNILLEDPLFQENQMLYDVSTNVLIILQQSAFCTPIIKFITLIEALVDKIDLWDNCVPKMYHLKPKCQPLYTLYINYKQKEKHSWRFSVQKRIQELWSVECIVGLKLYQELVNYNEQQVSDDKKVLLILENYLKQSVLGQFEIRYHIIKNISQQKWKKGMSIVVKQILQIIDIFIKQYNEQMKSSLKEFEDEFKEEMNLMSWKSTNYTLLRQASQKMQQRIVKNIKRIAGLFELKFSQQIVDQKHSKMLCSSFETFVTQLVQKDKLINLYYLDSKLTFLPLKKQKLIKDNYTKSKLKANKKIALWVHFENIIQDNYKRMNQLKETEAKQNVKQRALEEFYKYAESTLGLKSTVKGQAIKETQTYSTMIKIDPTLNNKVLQTQLQKCMNYYYTSVYFVQKTISLGKFTQDLPQNLIKKGLSVLIDMQRIMQKNLTTTLKIVTSFDQTLNKTENIEPFNLVFQIVFVEAKKLQFLYPFLDQSEVEQLKKYNSTIFKYHKNQITASQVIQDCEGLSTNLVVWIQQKERQALNFDSAYLEVSLLSQLKALNQRIRQLIDSYSSSSHIDTEVNNEKKISRQIKLIRILNRKYQQGIVLSMNPEGDQSLMNNEEKYLNTFQLLAKHYKDINQSKQSDSKEYHEIFNSTMLTIIQNTRSSCKFLIMITKVFCNILVNGFCSSEGEQQEGQGEDTKDGTGVGEGKGKDNVTKEIEFEEQVLGEQNKDEQPEQEEKKSQKDEKDKDEMNMENDFQGENSEQSEQEDDQSKQLNEDELQDNTNSSVNEENQENKNLSESEGEKEDENKKDEEREDLDFDQQDEDLKAKQDGDRMDGESQQDDDDNEAKSQATKTDVFSLNSEDEEKQSQEDQQEEEEKNDENEEGIEVDESDHEVNEDLSEGEAEQQQLEPPIEEENQEEQSAQEQMEKQKNQDEEDEEDEGQADKQGDQPKAEGEKEQDEEEKKDNLPQQQIEIENEKQGENEQNNGIGVDTDIAKEQQEKEEQKKQNDKLQESYKIDETRMEIEDILQLDANITQTEDNQQSHADQKDAILQEDSKVVTKMSTKFNSKNLKEQDLKMEDQDKNDKEKDSQKFGGEMEIEIETKQEHNDKNLSKEKQKVVGDDYLIENIDYDFERIKLLQTKSEEKEEMIDDNILLWQQIQLNIHQQASHLSEELKVVLKPTKCQGLKGDYKTGKRLNMKKVIPFIASNYKKDKIWLRRTLPSKRTYQIMIALDNSLSMKENNVDASALQSLIAIVLALQKMEVGEICVAKIGSTTDIIKSFSAHLNILDCPKILSQFQFNSEGDQSQDLSLVNFMMKSLEVFDEERQIHRNEICDQLCFIISDGRLNKKILHPLVKKAEAINILYIFIIVDATEKEKSIYNIKSTNYVMKNGQKKLIIQRYLEDFPFNYYIVINNLAELNKPLVNVIRQYYQLRNEI